MKTIIKKSGILVLLMIILNLSLSPIPSLAAEKKILVDGKQLITDSPVVENLGVVLAPADNLFPILGAKFQYLEATRTVIVAKGNDEIRMYYGSKKAIKNGTQFDLGSPIGFYYNRLYVPVRSVCQALNMKVEWDGESGALKVWATPGLNAMEWQLSLGKPSYGSPVAMNQGHYLVPSGNKLFSIDSNGKVIWELSLGKTGEEEKEDEHLGTPAIWGENIYIASSDTPVFGTTQNARGLYQVRTDGTKGWDYRYYSGTSGNYSGVPMSVSVNEGKGQIITAFRNNIYSFLPNGIKLWQFSQERDFHMQPIIVNDKRVVVAEDGIDARIFGLDDKGKKEWYLNLNGKVVKQWMYNSSEKTLYVPVNDSSGYGRVWKVNGENGAITGYIDVGSKIYSSPVLVNELVCLETENGLYAYDKTGKVKWKFSTLPGPADPKAGLNGEIYVAGNKSNVYAVNKNGEKIWETFLDSPANQIYVNKDGHLWVISQSGMLYSFKIF